MTDQFELRLASALRNDAETAVRPIDAVAIAARAMRRPAAVGWRRAGVRGLAIALLAGAALIGGFLLAGSDNDQTQKPSASPGASTAVPQIQAIMGADGRLLGASTWAADVEPIPPIGHDGGRLHFVSGYGGLTAALQTDDDQLLLASNVDLTAPPDELRVALSLDTAGCRAGDVGTYRLVASSDGLRISLVPVDEPCAARAIAFGRVWSRTFLLDHDGGPGFIESFEPTLRITLPRGDWGGRTYPNYFTVGRRDAPGGFDVARNPQGVTEPCVPGGGQSVSIGPGAAAFEAYLEDLPNVSVASSALTIGGYPARHLVATWTRSPDCPATGTMLAWRLDTLPVHLLFGGLTGTDELYLVDVGGVTLQLTIIDESRDLVLDELRFQTSLENEAPP